ncbi:hypothetical protein GH714_023723 [Hevea brasiliensis]|uniref:RING-type domain-containing protein n=1 Tax=Hevea brasiliensis TaxID=3981 RepID=A0A6A6MP34_HEVBR|nr:hypothetical protein GH714_023723 [Hevea brasiliensis]
MMDYYELAARSSYQESLKGSFYSKRQEWFLSANATGLQSLDIHLSAINPMDGLFVYMLFKSFPHSFISAVILPSLQRLHCDSMELDITREEGCVEVVVNKRLEDRRKVLDMDLEREDECGICLEPCTKMVVPSCCHTMCVNCYHDWNTRSESCPFCRGSLKRVNSGDLWVLTCSKDVVDTETVLREDLLRFYLYINSLPKDIPDALFLVYYEYLI